MKQAFAVGEIPADDIRRYIIAGWLLGLVLGLVCAVVLLEMAYGHAIRNTAFSQMS